jgi:hypothetical protein
MFFSNGHSAIFASLPALSGPIASEILVVDDEADIRELVADVLLPKGGHGSPQS